MKNNILIIIFTILPLFLMSQVGIGTNSPQQEFHIDAAQNNVTAPTNTRNNDDVVITADGKLGIGNVNPIAKVDVRNDLDENVIGIGTTTQSASAAGAGAVQYSSNGVDSGLAYSDGSNWIFLPSQPVKAIVYANKSTSQNINTNTVTTITGWDEVTDNTNSFNHNTGVFTAPKTGVYIVSLNLVTQSGSIANNSSTETIIESNTSSGVPQFRCVNSYPGYTSGTATNMTGNNCTGIFHLQQGNTINPRFWQNISSSRNIAADESLNTLTISEL